MRRLTVGALAALALLGPTAPAFAAKPPPAAPPVHLLFWHNDGSQTETGFTRGASADGDRMAVTLDGVSATGISAISFENWWGQSLASVSQLKISTQEPIVGGSPRISITLSTSNAPDATWDAGTLFLDPGYCNTSNSNGWRMSNWTGGVNCTIWDDQGRRYDGNGVMSAWQVMLASGDHAGAYVYYAYVIQDQAIVSRVDRITLDSKVFSK